MTWTVLLTAPQREFKVRDDLTYGGVRAIVPVEFRLGKGRQPRALKRPILPGYVFACIIDRWSILHQIDGLRSRPILTIEGRPVVVSPAEIQAAAELSRPLAALERGPTRLRPGQRIAIKRGHLATLDGLVTRITASGKPVAVVEMLGKAHEVVVTEDMLVG